MPPRAIEVDKEDSVQSGIQSMPPATSNSIVAHIDANIFSSLYSYSNDDLEKLYKVKMLIADGAARLYEPDQVFETLPAIAKPK